MDKLIYSNAILFYFLICTADMREYSDYEIDQYRNFDRFIHFQLPDLENVVFGMLSVGMYAYLAKD